MFNDLIYTIVPSAEVTQNMVDVCLETSFETLRHTVTGDDFVVLKWDGITPPSLSSYVEYNHEQILTVMATSAWSYPME